VSFINGNNDHLVAAVAASASTDNKLAGECDPNADADADAEQDGTTEEAVVAEFKHAYALFR